MTWLSQSPHPADLRRDAEIANWIRSSFQTFDLDFVRSYSYEVLLSVPSGINKVRLWGPIASFLWAFNQFQ